MASLTSTVPSVKRQFSQRVGQNLRALRIAAGLTQAQLAMRAGVPQRSVARWESGASFRLPTVTAASRLAKALGATVDDLVAGE